MMCHLSSRRRAACRVLIVLGTLFLASAGRESRGTGLTDSNLLAKQTAPPYATVTVTQQATDVVEFTVVAGTDYYMPSGNFGITSFTFNTDFPMVPSDFTFTFVTPSAGCNPTPNPPANPFGSFNWRVTSAMGAPTLTFRVRHTGATPAHFMIKNMNQRTFAANISNFTKPGSTVTSHWVSDSLVLLLLLIGAAIGAAIAGGLCVWYFLRKRSKAGTPEVKGIQDVPQA
jgi:hypothetical protein